MKTLDMLLSSPAVEIFGWALLHSLWQAIILAVLLKAVLNLSKNLSANTRYLAACMTFLLMLLLPLLTALWGASEVKSVDSRKTGFQITESNEKVLTNLETTSQTNFSETEFSYRLWIHQAEKQFLPWLVLLWLIGVSGSSLRLFGVWTYTQQLKLSGKQLVLEQCRETLQRLSRELRVSKPVVLLESSLVKVPTVIGWLKPMILVPSCALGGLTPQQFELILAHELAHIRRHDYLVNLFQAIIETLLFYHPAVWWVSTKIRNERENACDDLAVNLGDDPLVYARTLIEIERLRKGYPSLGMAADGGSLTMRIHRLIGIETTDSKHFAGVWMVVFIGILMVTVAVANRNSDLPEEQILNEQLTKSPYLTNSKSKEEFLINSEQHLSQENSSGKKPTEESAHNLEESPELKLLIGQKNDLNEKDKDQQESESEPQDDSKDFIDEMASVGYTNLSVSELVRLKEADVTANYVKSLNAVGFNHLTVKELWRLGINEIKPAYIRAIKNAGYSELKPIEAALFAEHDITPEYINKLRDAGYDNLSIWQLIDFAASDVTPEFIKVLRAIGLGNLSPKQLARLSVLEVTPEFIRRAQSRSGSLTVEQIIRLKEHDTADELDDQG